MHTENEILRRSAPQNDPSGKIWVITSDSFFAPLFYFSIGGLPLAWFYRFSNTADAMIAYRTPELEFFGKFAARLDDVLNWLPARLAGFFGAKLDILWRHHPWP